MQTTLKKSKGYSLLHIIVIIGLIIMIAVTYYHLPHLNKITEPVLATQPTIDTAVESVIEEPPQQESAASSTEPTVVLPLLDESDQVALASTQQLLEVPQYESFFIKQEMIRDFVVFVDNFSRGDLVTNFSPLARPTEPFSVIKIDNKIFLDTKGYNRYDIYADIIDAIDIDAAVQQYRHLQPLIDEAFEEIAHPNYRFIDKLYETIDLILDTPVIRKPIELITPSVMYKFADENLENRPAAQKLLIRMGPDNLLKIKEKLKQARARLAAL